MKFSILALLGLAFINAKKIVTTSKTSKTNTNQDDQDSFDDNYLDFTSHYRPYKSYTRSTHTHRKQHTNTDQDTTYYGNSNVRVFRYGDYSRNRRGALKNSNSRRYSSRFNSRNRNRHPLIQSRGFGRLSGHNQWRIHTNGHSYPITAIEFRRNGRNSHGRVRGHVSRNYRLQLGNFGQHRINQRFTFGSRNYGRFHPNRQHDLIDNHPGKHSTSYQDFFDDEIENDQNQNKKTTKNTKTAKKAKKATKAKKIVTTTSQTQSAPAPAATKKITKVTTTKTTTTDENGKTTTSEQKKVDAAQVKKVDGTQVKKA